MGKITVELIRKRAEHNEGEIHSLEELALHQEKLEKIELLDRICRKLKILMLQNNAISKLENLSRLKDLEYLNLALNSVEKVENLEGCESLKKLDLTLNFIGEISTIKSLRPNYYLEQLYLVGNPCHEFPGYRDYIIAMLPQLKQLDGADVTKSERLQARQKFHQIEEMVMMSEEAFLREKQRSNAKSVKAAGGDKPSEEEDDIDNDEVYWSKATENTPENRLEMCRRIEKQDEKKTQQKSGSLYDNKPKPARKFFDKDGLPLSCNEPKLSFTLNDDMERNILTLDLAVQRHLCTTMINVDVQPTYLRIKVKNKTFQIRLPEEVKPDSSYAQRSQTTGHLIVSMPKVYENSVTIWKGGSSKIIDLTSYEDSGDKPKRTHRKFKDNGDGESTNEKKHGIRNLKKTKDSDNNSSSWNDYEIDTEVPPLI